MKLDFTKLSRINVVGTSGSGKTTLASELALIINRPYIEMDSLYWKDNWQFYEDKEFLQRIERALEGEQWVLDGNYNRTQSTKWKRVQTIIWLDYPFYLVFYQMLVRCIKRILNPKPLWGTNNQESFRLTFMNKDSILLWMITSYPRMKKRYQDIFSKPSEFQLIRLTSIQEKTNFLNELKIFKSVDSSHMLP